MAYEVLQQGTEEVFGYDEQSVVRKLLITPWSARKEFYGDVLGGVTLRGGRLFRVLPQRHPEFPWLFAQVARAVPYEEDYGAQPQTDNVLARTPNYTSALVDLTYKRFDNDLDGDGPGNSSNSNSNSNSPSSSEQQEIDLATMTWDFSARNLKLPNQWYIWKDGYNTDEPLPNQEVQVTKMFPGLQMVLTRHLVQFLPQDAILGQLGRLNSQRFQLGGKFYEPETLRFDSAKASRKVTSQGFKFYEISYTFAVQPVFDYINQLVDNQRGWVGWNRLYDPKKGFWRYVKSNTTPARTIYDMDVDGPKQTIRGVEVGGYKLLFHPQAR